MSTSGGGYYAGRGEALGAPPGGHSAADRSDRAAARPRDWERRGDRERDYGREGGGRERGGAYRDRDYELRDRYDRADGGGNRSGGGGGYKRERPWEQDAPLDDGLDEAGLDPNIALWRHGNGRWRVPGQWRGHWMCTVAGCARIHTPRKESCYECNGSRTVVGVPIDRASRQVVPEYALESGCTSASAAALLAAATAGYGAPVEPFYHIPTRVLLVRWLSHRTTESEMVTKFGAYGAVEEVWLPSPEAPLPCGRTAFALVVFSATEDAAQALAQCTDFEDVQEGAVWMARGVGCVTLAGTSRCEVTYAREDAVDVINAFAEAGVHAGGSDTTPLQPYAWHNAAAASLAAAALQAPVRQPLLYDAYGSYYVFDASTGLFFEHSQQYWYDAASKLYLDALTWQYSYWDSTSMAYVPWTPPPPEGLPPAGSGTGEAGNASRPSASPAFLSLAAGGASTTAIATAGASGADASNNLSSSISAQGGGLEKRSLGRISIATTIRPSTHAGGSGSGAQGAGSGGAAADQPAAFTVQSEPAHDAASAPPGTDKSRAPRGAGAKQGAYDFGAPSDAAGLVLEGYALPAGIVAICVGCRRGFGTADLYAAHMSSSAAHMSTA